MPLKFQTKTYLMVEYYVLEQFIKEETGFSYEIAANEEWSNDSEHTFVINGEPLDEWNQKDWLMFKTTGRQKNYILRSILEGLCVEGKIPSGTYLVSVQW